MLDIQATTVGPLWVNSYLVWDRATGEGILIDPGDEGKRLIELIRHNGVKIKNIVITHGHFDHVKDAGYVSSVLKAPVLAHRDEIPLIEHVSEQAEMFGFPPVRPPRIDSYLGDGDTVFVSSYGFEVHNTPGHSPGSIILYNKSEGAAIVGDLIFFESVGRTDLPGGDYDTLLSSIKRHILILPDSTRLLTGHGEPTTVGHERAYNPFLTGMYRDET
ncbi:MAG: MBL fold metallo-hydrolase [Deltaproteobacteria bacterium]|nr:MBL fold metallo-hydrolase [Deltaproteobacteria bacterium]MCL5277904.1 MBL fold metallo-hydrolase [Deltaproteobacteria bacterium]